MSKRVVITGMGWVTPLGWDIEAVWRRLLAGESGVAPIRRFDASTFPTKFAAEVPKDYDHRAFVGAGEPHEDVGANTAFALGAAAQAWRAARLDAARFDPARFGIYLGSGEGSIDHENYMAANLAGWDPERGAVDGQRWAEAARERFSARGEIEQEPNMPLTHLAMAFGTEGPSYNCLTACAASTQAIGEATEILRRGDADLMFAGGAHTMIHPLGVTGFNRLTALSTRNDEPATASRPFSVDRDGFVLGEGGGMLVIETLDHAKARGAPVLAEITGYGSSADAFRITDIHPEGRGPRAAMSTALAEAGLAPRAVDYVSAHGTGTKENDEIETKALKSVFGDGAHEVPVSSVKSMLGHLIAAAGVVEAIVSVLAIRDQILPPTMNLHQPDPQLDLDYVPHEPRRQSVEVVLSNSMGFGGQNDTIILQRAPEG